MITFVTKDAVLQVIKSPRFSLVSQILVAMVAKIFFLKKEEIVITKCPNAEYSEKELMIPKELYIFFLPLYWFQPKFSDPCFTAGKYSMRLGIQYIPLHINVSGSSLCRLYKLQKLIKFPSYITFWFQYISKMVNLDQLPHIPLAHIPFMITSVRCFLGIWNTNHVFTLKFFLILKYSKL